MTGPPEELAPHTVKMAVTYTLEVDPTWKTFGQARELATEAARVASPQPAPYDFQTDGYRLEVSEPVQLGAVPSAEHHMLPEAGFLELAPGALGLLLGSRPRWSGFASRSSLLRQAAKLLERRGRGLEHGGAAAQSLELATAERLTELAGQVERWRPFSRTPAQERLVGAVTVVTLLAAAYAGFALALLAWGAQ